jgi:phosphatidylglycerophosphate synthase
MFDPLLRNLKDRVLHPIARTAGGSVSPNAVTVVTLLVGLAAAAALVVRAYPWALGLWLLNRVLDGLDGAIARLHGRQTDFGGYLDILCDFVVYAAIPIGLAFGLASHNGAAPLAAAVLVGAFYVNAASWMYLSALLEKRAAGASARGEPTSVTMPGGLVEGTETIVFFSLFILLPGQAVLLMPAMTAAVAVTVVQRLVWARRNLRTTIENG